jgi:hypothetical protein
LHQHVAAHRIGVYALGALHINGGDAPACARGFLCGHRGGQGQKDEKG